MAWIIVSPSSPCNNTGRYIVVNEKRWKQYVINPIPGGFPSCEEFEYYAHAKVKQKRLNGEK